MINLTPLSPEKGIFVSDEEFLELASRKKYGWSHCENETEWLAKLRYLRQGHSENKIERKDFLAREEKLVLNWWRRWA